jgi:hypothetical protein
VRFDLVTVHDAQEVDSSWLITQWQIYRKGRLTSYLASNQVTGAIKELNTYSLFHADAFQHFYVDHVINNWIRKYAAE